MMDEIVSVMKTTALIRILTDRPIPGSQSALLSPKRSEMARVAEALSGYCDQHAEGDKIPTHTELMRSFDASERNILRALDDLHREGRIVRRPGAGTFVASRTGRTQQAAVRASRSIIAITRSDQSFFDRCVDLLFNHVRNADLELLFHVVNSEANVSSITASLAVEPLGFIVFSYNLEAVARQLRDSGRRIVMVGTPRASSEMALPTVSGDQEMGGYFIVKHLIEQGHTRIGFAHPGPDLTQQRRWLGYQRAIGEALQQGRSITQSIVVLDENEEWAEKPSLVREYFSAPTAPTAIAAWNDIEAVRVLRLLESAGLKVPEDVSLTGYDAISTHMLPLPYLTTVDGNIDTQLAAAVRVLSGERVGDDDTVLVAPNLIVRDSVGSPQAPGGLK